MANSWTRSWTVAKESLAVLQGNPQLVAFPVVSGIASLIITASFALPAYFALRGQEHLSRESFTAVHYALVAAFYLATYFVTIFFNVGMVACTKAALEGRTMTFSEGVHEAGKHLGAIAGWTLVSATVGLLLKMLSDRGGLLGSLAAGLIGGAWNIVTYFVLPIIAIEDKGPVQAIKESGSLLKRTWGEQIIGNGGIGLAIVLFALLPIIPITGAIAISSTPLIVGAIGLSVVYWLVLGTIGASLSGIYQTALYVFATSGTAPNGFTQDSIVSAFRPKKQK